MSMSGSKIREQVAHFLVDIHSVLSLWTKRGCEEMRIHFFTAPFLLSLFTPGSKKQEKKGILPPFPQNSAF